MSKPFRKLPPAIQRKIMRQRKLKLDRATCEMIHEQKRHLLESARPSLVLLGSVPLVTEPKEPTQAELRVARIADAKARAEIRYAPALNTPCHAGGRAPIQP